MWILIRKYLAGFLLVVISLIDANILASQPAVNAYQRIYKVKKEKMAKFLELDEKKAEEFFQMYGSMYKQIEIKNDELGLAIKKLSFSLDNVNSNNVNSDKKETGEISQRIKDVQNYQKEIADLAFAVSENAEKILDQKQYARFLIFERRFKQELRKFFQRKRGKNGSGHFRGGQ